MGDFFEDLKSSVTSFFGQAKEEAEAQVDLKKEQAVARIESEADKQKDKAVEKATDIAKAEVEAQKDAAITRVKDVAQEKKDQALNQLDQQQDNVQQRLNQLGGPKTPLMDEQPPIPGAPPKQSAAPGAPTAAPTAASGAPTTAPKPIFGMPMDPKKLDLKVDPVEVGKPGTFAIVLFAIGALVAASISFNCNGKYGWNILTRIIFAIFAGMGSWAYVLFWWMYRYEVCGPLGDQLALNRMKNQVNQLKSQLKKSTSSTKSSNSGQSAVKY